MKTITQTNKLFAALAATAMLATLALPFAASAAHVVTISGDTSAGVNQPGWLFNRDLGTQTPYEFNTDESVLGEGSLYVLPIQNNVNADKFIAELFPEDRLAVSDLESFSYDFLIGDNGTAADANEFYLNVYANFGESADDKFFDCRYNVVPTTGSTTDWTTVTFDPTQAYEVSTRTGASASPYTCPAVPADMDSLSSSTEDSNIRVMAINMGDTSVNDQDLNGYFDNVVLTTDTETVYDFEVAEAFDRTATITAPTAGEEVSGVVDFAATLNDEDGDDTVQWAVRTGTCNGATVAGNVDGFTDPSTFVDGESFMSSVNMSTLPAGDYCFIFNPTESAGDEAIRLTSTFTLVEEVVEPEEPTAKDECKDGGYEALGFKNQGQCIKSIVANENGKNKGR